MSFYQLAGFLGMALFRKNKTPKCSSFIKMEETARQMARQLSLLAAWHFWTFHNKLHNMKALVFLSHSWLPFLPLACLYRKHELLWVSVGLSEVFSREKTSLRLLMQITWPWPPVGRFSHGLITVRQKKVWT